MGWTAFARLSLLEKDEVTGGVGGGVGDLDPNGESAVTTNEDLILVDEPDQAPAIRIEGQEPIDDFVAPSNGLDRSSSRCH